jgi:hypothetical protein
MVDMIVFIYENKRMKPVEIFQRRKVIRRMMDVVNLKYIVSKYVNIIMYPPVQILYANKIF